MGRTEHKGSFRFDLSNYFSRGEESLQKYLFTQNNYLLKML